MIYLTVLSVTQITLLIFDAVLSGTWLPMFRKYTLPSSTGYHFIPWRWMKRVPLKRW
jgi:hypothetical protein